MIVYAPPDVSTRSGSHRYSRLIDNVVNNVYHRQAGKGGMNNIFHSNNGRSGMNPIKFSAITLMTLFCVAAMSAEWKNPDKQEPAGAQGTDRNAPVVQSGRRATQTTIAATTSQSSGDVRLETAWFCNLEETYSDRGSGGNQDVAFYQPRLPAGYSMLGGYAQGDYDTPSGCVLGVKPADDASTALLQTPSRWRQVWTDQNSGARMDGSIWQPESPGADYVCLGSVAVQGYGQPYIPNYTCVHQCLVEEVPVTGQVWSDAGTGARTDASIYRLHNSNGYYAVASHNSPRTLVDIRRDAVCKF
jgi:hypothetical protein